MELLSRIMRSLRQGLDGVASKAHHFLAQRQDVIFQPFIQNYPIPFASPSPPSCFSHLAIVASSFQIIIKTRGKYNEGGPLVGSVHHVPGLSLNETVSTAFETCIITKDTPPTMWKGISRPASAR